VGRLNVGLIGCGTVGMKRALSLGEHKLVIAVDTDIERAKEVAKRAGCTHVSTNPTHLYFEKDIDVDLVIISTTNDNLARLTLDAVINGKHVLVEKPAGRTPEELAPVIREADRKDVFVKVGFNHRFHPALLKAKEFVKAGALGKLMYVRGRYGHGGRLGYEKEWRANPEKSGGGELIDQGVHLIDLSRWFLGDLDVINSYAHTYFWDMPVDDNAFLMLKSKDDKVAWLHMSCTEWKNMFSFEIFGKKGKLMIEGLGGSYGMETLTYYKMSPKMGIPEIGTWKYTSKTDESWKRELDYFIQCINIHKKPEGDISDAKKALDIVKKVYANR
jgi:predicted dehydrogenase